MPRQTPWSNCERALAIAFWTSSRPASATRAKTSPVDGLTRSKYFPEAAATSSPPANRSNCCFSTVNIFILLNRYLVPKFKNAAARRVPFRNLRKVPPQIHLFLGCRYKRIDLAIKNRPPDAFRRGDQEFSIIIVPDIGNASVLEPEAVRLAGFIQLDRQIHRHLRLLTEFFQLGIRIDEFYDVI